MKSFSKNILGAFQEAGKRNNPKTQKFEPLVWSEDLIMSLDWRRFEELCEWYFEKRDFITKSTSAGADGGIDIELYKKTVSTTDPIGLVQCKRQASPVELKSVRNFAGAMNMKGVEHGVFITSGKFKPSVYKELNQSKTKLSLWTGKELIQNILKLPRSDQNDLLKKTTSGDFTTPTCVRCETKMVVRENSKTGEKFWGCKKFPKCRSKLSIAGEKKRIKKSVSA